MAELSLVVFAVMAQDAITTSAPDLELGPGAKLCLSEREADRPILVILQCNSRIGHACSTQICMYCTQNIVLYIAIFTIVCTIHTSIYC